MKQQQQQQHYVNNKEFLELMIEFKEDTKQAEEKGIDKPRIPNEIGEIFVKIARHLSYKSNFINYGFREDMISDGIENCIQYIHNFDPNKSRNPFAYFTQIIYYAFLRRIQKEKKHLYVKYKTLENSQIMDDTIVDQAPDAGRMSSVGIAKLYDNMSEFIGAFEDAIQKKKDIKSRQRKMTNLVKKPKTRKKKNTVLQHATNLKEDEA